MNWVYFWYMLNGSVGMLGYQAFKQEDWSCVAAGLVLGVVFSSLGQRAEIRKAGKK